MIDKNSSKRAHYQNLLLRSAGFIIAPIVLALALTAYLLPEALSASPPPQSKEVILLPLKEPIKAPKLSDQSEVSNRCFKNCSLNSLGLNLIRNYEGYSPFVYKDSVGIDTIGFGHVVLPGESFPVPFLGPDAEKLLERDVNKRVPGINSVLRVPLTSNQFSALVCFVFNVGQGTFVGKPNSNSILKRVNAEKHEDVPPALLLYNKAGGEVLKGLTRRRGAEGDLYAKD